MPIHWHTIAAVSVGYILCALVELLRARQRHRHAMDVRRVDAENERLAERTRASLEH